ncbi:fungal-specific transcription factor domain-containing protein [Chaetomium tenue]|uniref:Fungal-specific transcription factor domain-containing protein n=1 Tax=Chaetomium tenue TaxID=1854479 RepID=A0ACB7PID7_9PEZI|nr:fungal-specific transcription factor domain-containing protein [Chaetomium globosum]
MAQPYEPRAVTPLPRIPLAPMPRPQVSIERLPTRRMSNEPRESMNCKSCRKRKIKCNRLRPACEACQVFQCPCIYDAVPKKRGPKTDVLEALLKRVDGLEARLKDKKADAEAEGSESAVVDAPEASASTQSASNPASGATADAGQETQDTIVFSPAQSNEQSPEPHPGTLLDIYFTRFHDKPFYIFDESTLRQRLQLEQVPGYLVHAIYAVAARYAPHPSGYQSAVKLSEEYAAKSRLEIDTDDPSVDALQALVLLVTAFTASGKGKKAYMLLTSAVGMAMALELHRELDMNARVTPIERESRRRLFWTCYLLDRFMSCGSKRPSLISDRAILLRLPCWFPSPNSIPMEGDFFQSYTNLQHLQGGGKKAQGSNGMLIDICRILGTTNQYLAAGGVKGDSHFPWHSLSNLSKIRQDLDVWASGTEDVFSSVESLFGQPDSTVLVLSKLIYHLIHCLIYRPFLPIDLAELAGTGQHQSWQIEATNMCFLHANAIAELVELGKQTASVEWPAFVGYCICTAGTVHIHGAHYSRIGSAGDMNVFRSSTDFLSREMQQLSELRYAWASVQHQRETLQGIYHAHSELVKSLSQSPMRYSPVFTLEDFFDRYSNIGGPGGQSFSFDSANLSLADVVVDFTTDTYPGHGLYAPRASPSDPGPSRPNKRKNTAPSGRPRPDLKNLMSLNNMKPPPAPSLSTPSSANRPLFSPGSLPPQPSPGILHTPTSVNPAHGSLQQNRRLSMSHSSVAGNTNGDGLQNFSLGNGASSQSADLPHGFPSMGNGGFNPSFNFGQLPGSTPGPSGAAQNFDPMFGGIPTNAFGTPTPWHGDENGRAAGVGTTPKDTSPNESAATTGPGEEKDPFLSLLEQLAENESFMGGGGNELEFFLNGAPTSG